MTLFFVFNKTTNGIYTDDPDVVSALKDVMRLAADGSLDWAFDTNNLYEDDDHPEYKDYEIIFMKMMIIRNIKIMRIVFRFSVKR